MKTFFEGFGTENLQALFLIVISLTSLNHNVVYANFYKSTFFNWGAGQSSISPDGNDLQFVLTRDSGAGVQSKKQFLFGSIEVLIKLVPGNSAGTVTAYYLSTAGDARFEVDFEFLGNLSGQPYTIQTNIYLLGLGNREQQFKPWFDPTVDFHNYTIHWNPTQIVWFVDGHPIRVFRNLQSKGIAYPNYRGMNVYASLWNADDWATEGGRIKTDWNSAPFISKFRHLSLRACKWHGSKSIQQCASAARGNWWASPVYSKLSNAQEGQLKWVRDTYMIYDYCKDPNRYNGMLPPECYMQAFP